MTKPPAPLVLPAPAKINLFLHITGRRSDGYHELQTVFQLLDYGDELTFTSRPDASIELLGDHCDTPTDDNLVVRAARLLQEQCQCKRGATIKLDKRLPLGAGLGGGSSDAASTLLGLNRLWQLNRSVNELAQLGLRLGADVPVFVRGESAFGEGIGERLQSVELPPSWFLVIKPRCKVATGRIFSHQELTRNTSPITIRRFLSGVVKTRNDCLAVVCTLYPEIQAVMEWLKPLAEPRLTGTGACVFAAFDDQGSAVEVQQQVPANWQSFVAQGINRSPTHSALGLF